MSSGPFSIAVDGDRPLYLRIDSETGFLGELVLRLSGNS